MEGEHWDELVSSSSQNSHMVQRATRLWDSLLSRKSEYKHLVHCIILNIQTDVYMIYLLMYIEM